MKLPAFSLRLFPSPRWSTSFGLLEAPNRPSSFPSLAITYTFFTSVQEIYLTHSRAEWMFSPGPSVHTQRHGLTCCITIPYLSRPIHLSLKLHSGSATACLPGVCSICLCLQHEAMFDHPPAVEMSLDKSHSPARIPYIATWDMYFELDPQIYSLFYSPCIDRQFSFCVVLAAILQRRSGSRSRTPFPAY